MMHYKIVLLKIETLNNVLYGPMRGCKEVYMQENYKREKWTRFFQQCMDSIAIGEGYFPCQRLYIHFCMAWN